MAAQAGRWLNRIAGMGLRKIARLGIMAVVAKLLLIRLQQILMVAAVNFVAGKTSFLHGLMQVLLFKLDSIMTGITQLR
jgi:hypothetical protein